MRLLPDSIKQTTCKTSMVKVNNSRHKWRSKSGVGTEGQSAIGNTAFFTFFRVGNTFFFFGVGNTSFFISLVWTIISTLFFASLEWATLYFSFWDGQNLFLRHCMKHSDICLGYESYQIGLPVSRTRPLSLYTGIDCYSTYL